MLNKFFKTIHNKYSSLFRFIFFLRYLFLIFFISTALFLLIPNFLDYEKRAEIIKNSIFDNYNFKIIKFEKIKYQLFPFPNLELTNTIVDLDNSSLQLNIKSLKIYPELLSIYNDKKFRAKKIILKENSINLEFLKINFLFKQLLKTKNKLFLDDLNLKIKDNNNFILNVEKIKFANYGYNKNQLFGEIFGKKFNLELDKDIKNIKFKLINSGISADINLNSDSFAKKIKGVFKSKILFTNIKFNFDYNYKILNIYNSFFRSKSLSFNNSSSITFDPFLYVNSKFNIEEINMKKIKKIDLKKILQSKSAIKKINSKNEIHFKSKRFDRMLIDELSLTVESIYGTIDYFKKISISGNLFQCKGNINILEEYPLLFFNCFVYSKEKKNFLEIFSIKRKEENEDLKLYAKGNLNILNKKINFKEINLNDYKASKEDLIYFKENFENILFDKSFLEIFELKKIKKFILNIS
jgi:hypothetical protein